MNHRDCDPLALTTLVNTLAAALARELDDNELALWSAILTQLGDTLATISVQRGLCRQSTEHTEAGQ